MKSCLGILSGILSDILFGILFCLLACAARAESTPGIHSVVIDVDGQASVTQWRSSATWIWTQNHLRLQTAIEIPSHIASTLPTAMQAFVHDSSFKAPFKLQDDHEFLVLELRGPSELFKLGSGQSLRVTADYDHTNWMRNANCREANISLAEIENEPATMASASKSNAFFISLYCRPAKQGTWIEIAASDDVTLTFEPHGQVRFQSADEATEFWLPRGPHPRVLSDVIASDGNGSVSSRYELAVDPPVAERIPIRVSSDAQPILFPIDTLTGQTPPPTSKSETARPILGLDAQLVDAHGSLDPQRTGRASTELAFTARVEPKFSFGNVSADLLMPIRRLGAGLDARGAGTHLGYFNAGYEIENNSRVTWTFGAQAAVLDVHSPDRSTTLALAPSVTARLGSLYSLTMAPLDLISDLSIVRARADLPITSDQHNRLTLEAMVGRTWIQPQNNSWNVNGVSLGFVGEF